MQPLEKKRRAPGEFRRIFEGFLNVYWKGFRALLGQLTFGSLLAQLQEFDQAICPIIAER